VLGKNGPWIVISPGGRRGLTSDRALGVLLAEAGCRVLVYDRRNTGSSDIGFPGHSESHEQAEDLLALLKALGTGPAYVAGCSSGARLSLLLALHHPEAVKALLLWRVTGGPYAAKRKRLLLLTVSTSPRVHLSCGPLGKGERTRVEAHSQRKEEAPLESPSVRSQMSGVRQS